MPEADSKRHRRLALLGGVSGLLLAIGLLERRFEVDGSLAHQSAYKFQARALLPVGALGLLLTLVPVGPGQLDGAGRFYEVWQGIEHDAAGSRLRQHGGHSTPRGQRT